MPIALLNSYSTVAQVFAGNAPVVFGVDRVEVGISNNEANGQITFLTAGTYAVTYGLSTPVGEFRAALNGVTIPGTRITTLEPNPNSFMIAVGALDVFTIRSNPLAGGSIAPNAISDPVSAFITIERVA